jgi:hypothetical protein
MLGDGCKTLMAYVRLDETNIFFEASKKGLPSA